MFFNKIYSDLRDLLKEDKVFENVAREMLIELFANKKDFSKFKYTMSEYVIGMKD
jgi:hypothetical protein